MKISENTTVEIDFSITDADGNIVESTKESGPAPYIHGKEMMIQAVEDALLGKEEGESISVSVSPEQGFGKRDESLVSEMPREEFSEFGEISVGDEFQTYDKEGNPVFVSITEIRDDVVIVDANHPFADKTLTFNIDIRSVKETTDDDIENLFGHNHDHEGGCCGGDEMKDDPSCNSHGGCGCCGGH